MSPAICPWQVENLLFCTAGCFLCSFLALVLQTGELSFGFRHRSPQGEPQPLKYPSLWHFSCRPWESRHSSWLSSALPTGHIVVKCFLLSVYGYKTSFQLVFSWLFKMISLQFNCNSRLVLRGGLCSFHLLLCHLGSSHSLPAPPPKKISVFFWLQLQK